MKVASVSTYVMSNLQNKLRSQMQSDALVASSELATGEVYDKGLALGSNSNRYINNENNKNILSSLKKSNDLLAQRMNTMQASLQTLIFAGDDESDAGALVDFNNTLLGDPLTTTPETIQNSAQTALNAFVSAMNASYNGEYVFGGSNVSTPPMEYYEAGSGEGASKAVQDAFEKSFGFSITNKEKVAEITADQMDTFLDDTFDKLFEDPSWGDNFSDAEDGTITNRISTTGEDVKISVSANEQGFRDAMKNLVMVAEFGNIGLNDEAQSALANKARAGADGKSTGGAITNIIDVASKLGNSQARVAKANTQIDGQLKIYESLKLDLVGVDSDEASTRLNNLKTMLQISAEATNVLLGMSLVNYLR